MTIYKGGWTARVEQDFDTTGSLIPARPKNLVTYFGNYASGIQAGDRRVHILRDDDRETFCGLADRCGYGTPRIVGQPQRRCCEDCFREAQEVRRDG